MKTDLSRRFAALDRIAVPDLAPGVSRRVTGGALPANAVPPRRRIALLGSLALLVLAGSIASFVWLRAFFETEPLPPQTEPRSNYVFSNVRVDASSVDPEGNVLIRFDVAWSGDADPGIHRCFFTLYGADGQVVSELVREMALKPSGVSGIEVPAPTGPPVSAIARCDAARLDTPDVTVVADPLIPAEAGRDLDTFNAEIESRTELWAERFAVESWSVDQLLANLAALRHAESLALRHDPDDDAWWASVELRSRYEHLCSLLPEGHSRQPGCGP